MALRFGTGVLDREQRLCVALPMLLIPYLSVNVVMTTLSYGHPLGGTGMAIVAMKTWMGNSPFFWSFFIAGYWAAFRDGIDRTSPLPETASIAWIMLPAGFVAVAVGILLPTVNFYPSPRLDLIQEVATMKISITLDRGEDRGQNFGTLFEARTQDGSAVVGAGFQGVYNTHHRIDRHVVQFFLRPTDGERTATTQLLPRSTELAGTYLFDLDGEIYSSSEDVWKWNPSTQAWTVDGSDARERMRLETRVLRFDGGSATCDGVSILTPPDRGTYYRFFYAHGHLFFYHTYWAEQDGYRLHTFDDDGFSKLYACPWSPLEPHVDMERAQVITLPVVGEVPFSYGQYHDEVLTCSNIGGVYVFDGSWRMIVTPEIETSYQVYSMMNFYDRLLLAQYPTGKLFEYSGEEVTLIEGWPPVMEGVSTSAREAQTLAIYGGDLFVGVWPWAEMWRYSPDADRWVFNRRMLSHPPTTDETVHPYENESAAAGIVHNQWGQRVTSLVPNGTDLMISTSAKAPTLWEPAYDWVGDGKWKEYGTVTRMTMPGVVCAPLQWTEGPTQLEFAIDDEGCMSITQDGVALAFAKTDDTSGVQSGVADSDQMWKRGIFGEFGGIKLEGWLG
mgnify:CR=1 FL=1